MLTEDVYKTPLVSGSKRNRPVVLQLFVEGILFSPIPLETASLTMNIGQEETSIPAWIKNNAEWWADGQIPDSAFVSGIQWLISNGIMKIS
jgi:hypothetical protein